MTTKITAAGITSSINAAGNQGPKINITYFKIGPTIIPPVEGDPSTDITDSIYQGDASQLQYAVVNDNTVQYIITLDESVGDFDIGRIGLFMDNGDGTSTLFSITSIDCPNPDHKFATANGILGNRLTYYIYLAISNMATIANFTIQLLQLLSIPEVTSELSLPDPTNVSFNTYQVMDHSVTDVPAVAYRQSSSWFMSSERLIPGQGEGIVPLSSSLFDPLATIGSVVGLDSTNQRVIIGEPATNTYILGIRSGNEEISNYGIYVDPVNTYNPMDRLFVDTGVNAGRLTTIENNWPVGCALGPVSTTNATGYLCWIDFTMGFWGAGGQPGPPGPPGPQGPPGPSFGGGGNGFTNAGQCYLQKVGSNLMLTPYNGNNILINSTVQKIPAGGITLPPTGLLPSTLYYIYAFMSGTVMALEASTANHTTSTIDGVEIKNLDQSRTLVGCAMTVTGPSWADADGQLYVLSWFNKRPKKSITYISTEKITTSSQGGWLEIFPAVRNYFLIWANNYAKFSINGYHEGRGNNGVATNIGFDGVLGTQGFMGEQEIGGQGQAAGGPSLGAIGIVGAKAGLIEGNHYSTVLGIFAWGGGGTAWWRNYTDGSNGAQIPSPISLTMMVEG
jgi:Phage tail-collar fibre protein